MGYRTCKGCGKDLVGKPAHVDYCSNDCRADHNQAQDLKSLGSGDAGFGEKTLSYNPEILESFPNKDPDQPYWIRLVCEEFTSVCPKTGQPDWAEILINFIPDTKCVESKSLKLYLNSFRNHGAFHESVINMIASDLANLLDPKYLEVYGIFNPRGGIAIYPFVQKFQDHYSEFASQREIAFKLVPDRSPQLR